MLLVVLSALLRHRLLQCRRGKTRVGRLVLVRMMVQTIMQNPPRVISPLQDTPSGARASRGTLRERRVERLERGQGRRNKAAATLLRRPLTLVAVLLLLRMR